MSLGLMPKTWKQTDLKFVSNKPTGLGEGGGGGGGEGGEGGPMAKMSIAGSWVPQSEDAKVWMATNSLAFCKYTNGGMLMTGIGMAQKLLNAFFLQAMSTVSDRVALPNATDIGLDGLPMDDIAAVCVHSSLSCHVKMLRFTMYVQNLDLTIPWKNMQAGRRFMQDAIALDPEAAEAAQAAAVGALNDAVYTNDSTATIQLVGLLGFACANLGMLVTKLPFNDRKRNITEVSDAVLGCNCPWKSFVGYFLAVSLVLECSRLA